jgi:hypothetical protein
MTTKSDTKSTIKTKKLNLRRQSLRGLTVTDLGHVRGGACPHSKPV